MATPATQFQKTMTAIQLLQALQEARTRMEEQQLAQMSAFFVIPGANIRNVNPSQTQLATSFSGNFQCPLTAMPGLANINTQPNSGTNGRTLLHLLASQKELPLASPTSASASSYSGSESEGYRHVKEEVDEADSPRSEDNSPGTPDSSLPLKAIQKNASSSPATADEVNSDLEGAHQHEIPLLNCDKGMPSPANDATANKSTFIGATVADGEDWIDAILHTDPTDFAGTCSLAHHAQQRNQQIEECSASDPNSPTLKRKAESETMSPFGGNTLDTPQPKERRKVRLARKGVRVPTSNEKQCVKARQRRERISTQLCILQDLVPESRNLDTASLLERAIDYVKELRTKVQRV